jgi:putative SOS response-associated peptidase YedK
MTTAANSMLAAFHNRMPVLLSPEEAASWLAEPDARLLRAARDDLLVATPVSQRVNSIRHDDPACLAPPQNEQLRLF